MCPIGRHFRQHRRGLQTDYRTRPHRRQNASEISHDARVHTVRLCVGQPRTSMGKTVSIDDDVIIDIANLAATYDLHLFLCISRKKRQSIVECRSLRRPDGAILAKCDDEQPAILYADTCSRRLGSSRSSGRPGAHVIDQFEDRCPNFFGTVAAAKPTAVTHQTGKTTPHRPILPPAALD